MIMLNSFLVATTLVLGQAGPQAVPGTAIPIGPVRGTLGAPVADVQIPTTPQRLPATATSVQGTPEAKNPSGDKKDGNGEKNGNGETKKEPYPSAIFGPHLPDGPQGKGFISSLVRAYVKEFRKADGDDSGDDTPPPARRALPEPWSSPPFPGHEYQGYPLIGVPKSTDTYPFMQAIYDSTEGTRFGETIKDSGVKVYGWATAGGNFSTAKNSNSPTAYWIVPNRLELDQAIVRIEREVDSVQTDHVDVGFRSTFLYGIDYRYMTAGGWTSDQLLKNNRLNGFDMTEQYVDVYVPSVAQGMIVRVGRWVACPDIETQFAPDNYMASHSLLFTYDTYTQTGIMFTLKLSDQWMVQAALTAGTDMAPWYPEATPTGMFAVRWVSQDNKDATYTVLNNINDARFRRGEIDGQLAGHDNFNYIVTTWEHKFNDQVHTKTEAYFMWQRDAYVGGTPSIGSPQSFGGGGGAGAFIPGYSLDYGILNYTALALSKNDYLTLRNELWNDPQGERTGTPNLYSSHTIGWSHNFNPVMQFRPEIGFYHAYTNKAFDLGTTRNMVMVGFDFTFRF
jgi:hypothetical protein